MLALASYFKPERVIFLSDVDGIFDRNPKVYRNAELRKELRGNEAFNIEGKDVTGGMEKKLGVMIKIAENGAPVYLINGKHPERIHDIGKDQFIGTVIK